MTRINLREKSTSVEKLLELAREKSVLLVAKDGVEFVLEEADEFDREVAELGGSAKFMKFLRKRAREEGTVPIEELARGLNEKGRRKNGKKPGRR